MNGNFTMDMHHTNILSMNPARSLTLAKQKNNAVITGLFFIMATVTAIIGIRLYDPILHYADAASVAANANQIVTGAVFELMLAVANVGTAIMLYPVLRRINDSWGLAYVCFRLLEVVFIIIGILSLLSLLAISQNSLEGALPDASSYQMTANLFRTIHRWTFILGPHFMLGINTVIYSILLYKSKRIPRQLALMGITGAILIFMAAILELFSVIDPFSYQIILFALPIALYEMILAARLIIKGFNYDSISGNS